jgi:reactive intermediate/imine deaminase
MPEEQNTRETAAKLALLDAFANAYNRHDVDGIMQCMTNDCTFISYFGPEAHGERFVGAGAVRQRVAGGLQDFPNARWENARHFVDGDRGVTEWTFRGTRIGTSEPIERCGCDVFTFRDGKIHIKDTYQKWRQPPLARQEVHVPLIHPPVGRYVHAVKYRDMLFVSGCGPFDKHAKLVGAGDIVAQTRQTLENLKVILAAAGLGFANVIKETVYLTDINDRQATRAVREQFYGQTLPACTLIEISRCVEPDVKIEIEVVAGL